MGTSRPWKHAWVARLNLFGKHIDLVERLDLLSPFFLVCLSIDRRRHRRGVPGLVLDEPLIVRDVPTS